MRELFLNTMPSLSGSNEGRGERFLLVEGGDWDSDPRREADEVVEVFDTDCCLLPLDGALVILTVEVTAVDLDDVLGVVDVVATVL